jgi:RNA recognition motif-containing protein
MSKNIYVGNLSYSTTEDQLQETFAQYGEVASANIITDKYTNQSKGFAFVEMSDESNATAAISALNGAELNGRELRVSEAKARQNRERSY